MAERTTSATEEPDLRRTRGAGDFGERGEAGPLEAASAATAAKLDLEARGRCSRHFDLEKFGSEIFENFDFGAFG